MKKKFKTERTKRKFKEITRNAYHLFPRVTQHHKMIDLSQHEPIQITNRSFQN